jgi:geranylgeranyl reductase family protein
MEKYDLIIVGGGPVGSYLAGAISKEKYNVALFEKNFNSGSYLNCAGLVTPRVFELTGEYTKSSIQNKIKGANIHSPSDNVLTIGGDKIHAFVINRHIFDKEITKNAKEKGTNIFFGHNVLSAYRNKNQIEIKTSKNLNVKSKLIIGADGPFSSIRDRFFCYKPKDYLTGIGAELTNVEMNPDFVEIFVGKKIAPGFFAWIIPTNNKGNTARIGLCTNKKSEKHPKFYFEKFLKNKYTSKFLENAKIQKYTGGVIPLGFLKKTYEDNVMLVGDAAAHVKPTSVGGIYTVLLCSKYCSSVAVSCFKKNDFSQKTLKKYHKMCSKEIGSELNLGMKFRKIYINLSDKQLDKYIEHFNQPKIIEILNKYGDIDFPSKLVKPLLKKNPSLIKLATNLLKK